MSNSSQWGQCMECKWWQVEPDAALSPATHGLCITEPLQPYLLRVSAASGCAGYTQGEPARAKGSADIPPTAAPVR